MKSVRRFSVFNLQFATLHIVSFITVMGSICGTEATTDAQINTYMKDEENKDSHENKLLLLGPGSTGKSTLFKSIRSIHSGGVDENELISICPMTRANCIKAIQILCKNSQVLYDKYKDCFVDTKNTEISDHITRINGFDVSKLFASSMINWDEMSLLAKSMTFLWNLKGIQATYCHRGNNFAFEDNLDYFLDKCQTIFDKDYIPSEEDYKKTKVRTIGMVEYMYHIAEGNRTFRIIDVGGQRCDRRKWIYCFDKLSDQ